AHCAAAAEWATARRAPRTTRSEPAPPPTRTATPGSAGPSARRCRAPRPAAGTGPPPPVRGRGGPRSACAWVPPGPSLIHLERRDLLAPALQLDHEDAVDRRREIKRHAAALLHVLVEVVAVYVDLVRHVRVHRETHRIALVHGDLL